MLDDKKTYYWLEELNGMNFDMVCINKIFRAEIEKSKNKENDAKKSDKWYRKINARTRGHGEK